jgi:hypothetical protein
MKLGYLLLVLPLVNAEIESRDLEWVSFGAAA